MANQKIRIKLKAYECNLIDQSAEKIVDTAKRTGARVSGPTRCPYRGPSAEITRMAYRQPPAESFTLLPREKTVSIRTTLIFYTIFMEISSFFYKKTKLFSQTRIRVFLCPVRRFLLLLFCQFKVSYPI